MSAPATPAPGPAPTAATDNPRRELAIGGIVILLFFGLFLGWAAFAPLDAGAFAPGQVSVSGNRQAVQHREGGTVAAIHVGEGDRVARGQVLIELSSGELRAQERGVTGQVMALLAQRSRMIAERDGLAAVPAPPEFAGLAPEDQTLAGEALRLQRLQFAARRTGRSTESGVLGQRVSQLQQQMEGYERQIVSNGEQRRLIEEELEGMRSLAARGFAPENRVRALEREAARLDGEQGSLRAEIGRIREAIGQARLEQLGVSTKLNEDVADQLRQVEVQLNELQPRMRELRDQIARSQIRSPATGQVVGLTVFTPGGVIQPGQTLMEVVPDEADQVIVASVNPTDIDNIRIGQLTEVKFPGLRGHDVPIIHGRVTRVSADAFTDEQTGQSHYRAEIVVPEAELKKLGRRASTIRAGMPAETIILLRKRTALGYLIEPLTGALWRSGSEE